MSWPGLWAWAGPWRRPSGRVGDGPLVAGFGALLAAAFFVLGVGAGLVGGLGLDLRAGGLQFRQALLTPVQLGGQVRLFAVHTEHLVLGFVGGLRVGQQGVGLGFQSGDLGLDAFFLVDQAAVAHRLVFGGAGLQFGAVQRDASHLDHAELGREVQRLGEQAARKHAPNSPVTAAGPGGRPPGRHRPAGAVGVVPDPPSGGRAARADGRERSGRDPGPALRARAPRKSAPCVSPGPAEVRAPARFQRVFRFEQSGR